MVLRFDKLYLSCSCLFLITLYWLQKPTYIINFHEIDRIPIIFLTILLNHLELFESLSYCCNNDTPGE